MRLAAETTATAKSADSAPKPALREESAWVNVSHGLGIPLGTLGSGYSVFGKYGFVRLNFDGEPDPVRYNPYASGGVDYVVEPEQKSTFGFLLTVGDKTYVIQQTKANWSPAGIPADQVACYAYLPKGVATFAANGLDLRITVSMFSPLIAHDLKTSTLPVQIFDVTVENPSQEPRQATLQLFHSLEGKAEGNCVTFASPTGELAFGTVDGTADNHGVSVPVS